VAKVKKSTASDWCEGFLFVGNLLALDFLNTCPVQNGKPLELLPDFNAVLRWFRAAGLLTSLEMEDLERRCGASTRARDFSDGMRRLRENLRKELLVWEGTGKLRHGVIDELNQLMTEHPVLTRVKRDMKSTTTELWFKAGEPEDLFAPLAYSAATLFTRAERSRVRKCGQCVLHFYDTSKKGTRRWCSMQLCGNRLKIAAYAARQRARR